MEDIISRMDSFSIHLGAEPRHYPHPCPVTSVGYIARKEDWVRRAFVSFNFSLILTGEGEYRTGERIWSVKAPCVITQWPEVHVEYGPAKVWEELYIAYSAERLPFLEQIGFAHSRRPVWKIRDPATTGRKLEEVRELLQSPGVHGRADTVDRACEALLLESLLARDRAPRSPAERAIQTILAYVEVHFTSPIDFEDIALDHGLSPASFRRHWARLVGEPPGRHVTRLRMRRACRYLVETKLPISEIALAVGYEDPLYFSRRFRQATGVTATAYRTQHAAPLSLRDA